MKLYTILYNSDDGPQCDLIWSDAKPTYDQVLAKFEHLKARHDEGWLDESCLRIESYGLVPTAPSEAILATNETRAASVRSILPAFKREAGLAKEPDAEVIGDLLANIAHYCDAEGIELSAAIYRASCNYRDEVSSRGVLLNFGAYQNL